MALVDQFPFLSPFQTHLISALQKDKEESFAHWDWGSMLLIPLGQIKPGGQEQRLVLGGYPPFRDHPVGST